MLACDPEMVDDMIMVLNNMISMARAMRGKVRMEAVERAARVEEQRPARAARFAKKSRDVFVSYEKHLNNGCGGDKRKALEAVRRDFGLLAVDVRILVREGKRAAQKEGAVSC